MKFKISNECAHQRRHNMTWGGKINNDKKSISCCSCVYVLTNFQLNLFRFWANFIFIIYIPFPFPMLVFHICGIPVDSTYTFCLIRIICIKKDLSYTFLHNNVRWTRNQIIDDKRMKPFCMHLHRHWTIQISNCHRFEVVLFSSSSSAYYDNFNRFTFSLVQRWIVGK